MRSQQGWISWSLAFILFLSSAILSWLYYDKTQQNRHQENELYQLGNDFRRQKRTLTQAESSAENYQRDLTFLQSRFYDVEQKNTQLTAEVEQLTQSLQAAENQLNKTETERMTLNQEKEALTEQLDSTTQTLQTQNEQLASTQAEHEQALTTIASLQNKLSDAATTAELYQTARQQLALRQAENESYSETISRLQQEMENETAAMEALERQLQSQLSEVNQENEKLITQLEDGTTAIQLPESILFASGSADINGEGRKTLQNLAEALKAFPNHLISIQGHSDKRSISKATAQKYPTNWELSSARAASAVRELIATGIPPEQLQAVGFAFTHPLVAEVNAQTRQKNRRIEVILYPNRFTLKVLE